MNPTTATLKVCSTCLQRNMRATHWAEHGSRCHRCAALCCEHTSALVLGKIVCAIACADDPSDTDASAADSLRLAAIAVADELMCDVAAGRGGAFSLAQRRLLDVLRASGWEPMPKMMPGYEPYTREEYARIEAVVGRAAAATEVFDEDELERFAAEQRERVHAAEQQAIASRALDPDAQCPEHGCARWRCDADHPTARDRAKEST